MKSIYQKLSTWFLETKSLIATWGSSVKRGQRASKPQRCDCIYLPSIGITRLLQKALFLNVGMGTSILQSELSPYHLESYVIRLHLLIFIVYDPIFISVLSSTLMGKLDIRGIKLDLSFNDQGLNAGLLIYGILEKSLYNTFYMQHTNLKYIKSDNGLEHIL